MRGRGSEKYLFLFILLFSFLAGQAQTPQLPFVPGETIRYGAYYHWGLLWINAGEVHFSATRIERDKGKAWHLKATGVTHRLYDRLYTVRDTFETILSYPGFDPLWFRRVIRHRQDYSLYDYTFYPEKQQIRSTIILGKDAPLKDQFSYSAGVYDMLSAAYHFRSFDYDRLKTGQKVAFRTIIDSKVDTLYFRYRGKETVKTKNKRTFQCYKISVMLVKGDFFPGGEEMSIWFTADQNRVPVIVEAKILIGSVQAILIDEQNLKHPLLSEIKTK